jgi:hypothetical protein
VTENEIVSILRETLSNQTQVFRDGFAELQQEAATTRKWVVLLVALAMLLQAAMVGVGLHYSGSGGSLTITPSSTLEHRAPDEAPPEPPTPPPRAGANEPLSVFDFMGTAEATTDGTAPLETPSYGTAEPQDPAAKEAP